MGQAPRGGEAAAQRAWLRDLPVADAAKVMGSRGRLQQVLSGADPLEVVNRGVPEGYRTVRLGENLRMPHPQALPRASEAVIPDAKIAAYALNPAHDVGGHKARLFASVLGITVENRHLLEEAIRKELPLVPAMSHGTDQHGEKFQADIEVTGPKGGATSANWLDCARGRWRSATDDRHCSAEEAMTFKLFDPVAAAVDLPQGVRAGALGTVIEVYPDGSMDVDFEPDQEENLRVIAVTSDQVRLAQQAQAA